MRLGIFGGTFDPIHNGHMAIARCALDEARLDRVLMMPSGISYLKAGTHVSPGEVRAQMTRLAIEGCEGLAFDDRELRRRGNTYTCDTIEELRAERPEDELFFILGADSLLSIDRWKDPHVIYEGCTLLAAFRPDCSRDEVMAEAERLRGLGARIEFLSCPLLDISSTDIRTARMQGADIADLVPLPVRDYILEHDLYKGQQREIRM